MLSTESFRLGGNTSQENTVRPLPNNSHSFMKTSSFC